MSRKLISNHQLNSMFPGLKTLKTKETHENKEGNRRYSRSRMKDVILFSKLMSTLLRAGIPITESLASVVNQVEDREFREVLRGVTRDIRSGTSLAGALSTYPEYFDGFYTSVIGGGERNGSLAVTFETVYSYLTRKSRLQKKIVSAMVYPLFLLIFSLGAVMFMSLSVLPAFSGIYDSFERELPAVTRIILGFSDFIRGWWPLLLGASLGGGFLLYTFFSTERGRLSLHTMLLGISPVNSFTYRREITSFFPLLSLSLRSGMDIISSLRVANDSVRNLRIRRDLEGLIQDVMKGRRFSSALAEASFPTLSVQFVSAGELSNNLEEMMETAAAYYMDELEEGIDMLIGLIEPVMIIVVGGLVGVIVMAIMLPILSLSTAII